jgi:hypothetical protein
MRFHDDSARKAKPNTYSIYDVWQGGTSMFIAVPYPHNTGHSAAKAFCEVVFGGPCDIERQFTSVRRAEALENTREVFPTV